MYIALQLGRDVEQPSLIADVKIVNTYQRP